MSEEKFVRAAKMRDLERILDLMSRKAMSEEGFGFTSFARLVEQEPVQEKVVDDKYLRLSSEVQDLKNQFNRYLKTDAREESMQQFKELIAHVREVKEVYVEHKIDRMIFYVLYDDGSRTDVIEKVVDVEIELSNLFRNLKFDFHFFPYSDSCAPLFHDSAAIYHRRD